MLRTLYIWVLLAHPPYFRQRFAEEMQSIFDQAQTPGAQVGLLVDAGISLARQWGLRPQFWEQPNLAAATNGAPLFDTLGNAMPRKAALVYGAILSAFVLNGVSWTMGYAWNHPIFIEWRQPVIKPPASWATRGTDQQKEPVETQPPLYTDQGRVILIFNAPVRAAAQPTAKPTEPASPKNESKAPTASKQGMIF